MLKEFPLYDTWSRLLEPVRTRLKLEFGLKIDEISTSGDAARIDVIYIRTGQLKTQQTFRYKNETLTYNLPQECVND